MGDLRLVAVDARTGKLLWTRTGLMPAAVAADGSVIAIEWPQPASTSADVASGGTVTVLDAATGAARWSLRGRVDTARVAGVAGGVLLVRGQRGTTPTAPTVLDLATGRELGRTPAALGNCADDHTSMIACEVLSPKPRLVTIRADERWVRVSDHAPAESVISLVPGGRIYYSGVDRPSKETDASGTPLAVSVPGDVLSALSGGYAVFRSPESDGYQVFHAGP